MRRAGLGLPVALLGLVALAAGCSRRPHVAMARDGGPSVVVIERRTPDGGTGHTGAAGSPRGPGPSQPIELVDEKEPDDDLGHAQPIEYPKGIRGTLAPAPGGKADVDFYQWLVNAEGRQSVRVELGGAPPDATLEVLDKNGTPIIRGQHGEQVVPDLVVGPGELWFFLVRGGKGSGEGAGKVAVAAPVVVAAPYTLTLQARPLAAGEEEEPNDSAEHASAMAAGVEESGYFGRVHDEDWLRLPDGVPDAGTLRIELSPVEGVAASVRVRDAAGALLVEAKGARGDEVRMRNAPAAAGGLVVLRAESGRNVDLPWRLRLAAEPALKGVEVEPNGTPATATPIALEAGDGARTEMAGFLWPGDADLYRVSTGAPGLLDVTLHPPAGVDARIERLGDSGGVLQKIDQAGAGKPEHLRALPAGGEVLLRIAARPHDTAFESPYTLTFSLVPAPQLPDAGSPAP